jgi:hypothetical protein
MNEREGLPSEAALKLANEIDDAIKSVAADGDRAQRPSAVRAASQ